MTDVIDDVNALLKINVGDSYRLEHIKQAFIKNKTIWVTDENYLKRLREKYLHKQTSEVEAEGEIVFEDELKDKEIIHCWKCGRESPLNANFCMTCGTSIFEVGGNSQFTQNSTKSSFAKFMSLKILALVGIPVFIFLILGAAYTLGYFDDAFERSTPDTIPVPTVIKEDNSSSVANPKCGPGTVFDAASSKCIVN